MKKIKMMALAAALTLVLGVQSFAAPSAGTAAQGNVSAVSDELAAALQQEGKTVNDLGIAIAATSQVISKEEALTLLGSAEDCNVVMMDVTLTLDGSKYELNGKGAVDVKLNVAGIQASSRVVVRHQKADGEWETLNIKEVGDGYVVATFTSFSPVAVLVEQAAQKNESSSKNHSSSSDKQETKNEEAVPETTAAPETASTAVQTANVSPKTAETNSIVMIEMMAAAAFLGMAVCAKKARR